MNKFVKLYFYNGLPRTNCFGCNRHPNSNAVTTMGQNSRREEKTSHIYTQPQRKTGSSAC